MKARFIKEIGTRVTLRVYWGTNCCGRGEGYYHNAHTFIKDELGHNLSYDKGGHIGGEQKDYEEGQWPIKCDQCDAVPPPEAQRQVFNARLYNTDSGKPEPGDLWYIDWGNHYWDNDTDPHLMAKVPTGEEWDIDSRASNCGSPDDRTHRCWTKSGNPEDGTITVGKGGHTCSAGAGSIQTKNWHGYLRNGEWIQC